MKRKYNLRKIVSKRSYTTNEIGMLLKVHSQTIRAWRKEGLKPIEESLSPFLFLGSDIKAFLKNELDNQKTSLKPEQCYCLKCRKAVVPINSQIIDRKIKLGNGNNSAFLTGNCSECNTVLRRFTSLEIQRVDNQVIKKAVKSQQNNINQNQKNITLDGQLSMFSLDGEE